MLKLKICPDQIYPPPSESNGRPLIENVPKIQWPNIGEREKIDREKLFH